MGIDLSKNCSDYLRTSYNSSTNGKLKATHARELIAAFFGYKSHAALISEKLYPLSDLDEASILVPDIPLLEKRRQRLTDLPKDLPSSEQLAKELASFLRDKAFFNGDVWLEESLEEYVMSTLLHQADAHIMDELSGVMAETNAYFDEAIYETATISDNGDILTITVDGTYSGENHDEKPFSGDKIDMTVTVDLYRIAGRKGFHGVDISAKGTVNDDWVDPELRYGTRPQLSPKEQFIEMTGGFQFGENEEQFHQRQNEIKATRDKISAGNASVQDVEKLSSLLGTDEEDFEF